MASEATNPLTLKKRVYGAIATFVAGLIFLVSGIANVTTVTRAADFVANNFPDLPAEAQTILGNVIYYSSLVADFTGSIVLVAVVLILLGKTKSAGIILMITISAGLFGLAIPLVTAIPQGIIALQMAVEGIVSKYAIATLLVTIARLQIK